MESYLLWCPVFFSHILPILEPRKNFLHCGLILFQLLHFQALPTSSGLLLQIFKRFFNKLDIFDSELLADDREIADWIHIAFNMNYLRIVKATNDLEDGINRSDV